jgi:hypothetical protein
MSAPMLASYIPAKTLRSLDPVGAPAAVRRLADRRDQPAAPRRIKDAISVNEWTRTVMEPMPPITARPSTS